MSLRCARISRVHTLRSSLPHISVMRTLFRPILALAIMMALAASSLAQTPAPVDLRILAINDFHGYLRPPPGGITIADPEDRTKKITVPAGGAEHMATLVGQLREGHKNSIFVAAGDLIGASPFLSAMFHDEPTIEALSMMGLGYFLRRQSRIRRGQGRTPAHAEWRLPPGRPMPGTASVYGREIPLSRRQHVREEQRQDRVSSLRNPQRSTAFRSPSSA